MNVEKPILQVFSRRTVDVDFEILTEIELQEQYSQNCVLLLSFQKLFQCLCFSYLNQPPESSTASVFLEKIMLEQGLTAGLKPIFSSMCLNSKIIFDSISYGVSLQERATVFRAVLFPTCDFISLSYHLSNINILKLQLISFKGYSTANVQTFHVLRL